MKSQRYLKKQADLKNSDKIKNTNTKGQSKIDALLESVYNNKWILFRYFLVALFCSFLRYVFEVILSVIFKQPLDDGALLSWCIWSLIFYPCVKFFALRVRSSNIYSLLKQIIIYILCCAVLWVSRQLFVSILFVLSSNQALALAAGGVINELLCLGLMIKVVFREK